MPKLDRGVSKIIGLPASLRLCICGLFSPSISPTHIQALPANVVNSLKGKDLALGLHIGFGETKDEFKTKVKLIAFPY